MLNFFKSNTMFKKTFIKLSFFITIPLLIINILSVNWLLNENEKDLLYLMQDNVVRLNDYLDEYFNSFKLMHEYINTNSTIYMAIANDINYKNVSVIDNELINLFRISQQDNFILVGSKGQVYAGWDTDGSTYTNDVAGEIYNSEIIKSLNESNSDYIWYPLSENFDSYSRYKNVITFAGKIKDYSLLGENEVGVLLISVPNEIVSQELKNIEAMSFQETFIVNSNNLILAHDDYTKIGTYLDNNEFQIELHENENGVFWADYNKEKLLYIYDSSLDTGWTTVVSVPAHSLNQTLNEYNTMVVFVSILFICLTFFISFFVARTLSLPIKELNNTIKHVSKGEISLHSKSSKVEEVEELRLSYNDMMCDLQKWMDYSIKTEKENNLLKLNKLKTELDFLRAQINPHFLFNTLNSIKCMAMISKNTKVVDMVCALGKILECSMQKGNDMITLKEEILNTQSYITLQQIRNPNLFKIYYDISKEIEEFLVPKLILQPIVENSIIHGFKSFKVNRKINIIAKKRNSDMIIEIIDNGTGFLEKDIYDENVLNNEMFNGIGLANCAKRLDIVFGEEYGIVVGNRKDNERGTYVCITIPLIKNE